MTRSHSRGVLRLTADCNNRCVFCAQDPGAVNVLEVETSLAALRADHDELTLAGGEPTLVPTLAAVVACARRLGFTRVGLQTNGRRLCDGAYTRELARAGLTDVHFSLHGATPEAHDYHTGVTGTFAEAIAGMQTARLTGLELVVTTVVTRSNFRLLSALPPLLAAREVSGWLLVMPHAAGRGHDGFDRIVPRHALALPFALHALSLARQRGISAWIRGAPRCLLGPHGDWSLSGEVRSFAAGCETCRARKACDGVDASYLERFGDTELLPTAETTLDPEPVEHSHLIRAFVGTGPMLAVPAAAVRPGSAASRRSLPIAQKAQPGAQEVPRSAQKRTGEDLREILPDLFSDADD
jgi:hypothetical protein